LHGGSTYQSKFSSSHQRIKGYFIKTIKSIVLSPMPFFYSVFTVKNSKKLFSLAGQSFKSETIFGFFKPLPSNIILILESSLGKKYLNLVPLNLVRDKETTIK
jgi:hypothetical protein